MCIRDSDVGGVGYDLAVPLGAEFDPGAGGPEGIGAEGRTRVFTHLVVREDAQLLYGFPDRAERDFFRLLLSVRGIGPGIALGILSSLPRAELAQAIAGGDSRRLQRVKGVGRKTAEQIVLDLRDKAHLVLASGTAAPGVEAPAPPADGGLAEDAVAALISIGFSEREARRNVERAADEVEGGDLELLVRTALRL